MWKRRRWSKKKTRWYSNWWSFAKCYFHTASHPAIHPCIQLAMQLHKTKCEKECHFDTNSNWFWMYNSCKHLIRNGHERSIQQTKKRKNNRKTFYKRKIKWPLYWVLNRFLVRCAIYGMIFNNHNEFQIKGIFLFFCFSSLKTAEWPSLRLKICRCWSEFKIISTLQQQWTKKVKKKNCSSFEMMRHFFYFFVFIYKIKWPKRKIFVRCEYRSAWCPLLNYEN